MAVREGVVLRDSMGSIWRVRQQGVGWVYQSAGESRSVIYGSRDRAVQQVQMAIMARECWIVAIGATEEEMCDI